MRVPLGLPLGETGKKHREGETLGPGLLAFWGMGSSGNLLGEQGQGNLPAGSLGRTGKKGIRLNPWPLPKDLFLLDSLARAARPLQNCAREHTHSCFFQQYLTIIQKNDRLLGKRLFTYPILRSFFSYKLLCAKDIVLRKQGSKCPVSHEKVMNVQNVTISW